MNIKTVRILFGFLSVGILGCLGTSEVWADNESPLAIIPLPRKIKRQQGEFRLKPEARIFVDMAALQTGKYLAAQLRNATGYELTLEQRTDANARSDILLTTHNSPADIGPEGYTLSVASNAVVIRAKDAAGFFYGVQTLLQLFPSDVFSPRVVRDHDWKIPCVQIEDEPRFKWRGFMLDCARHFFTVPQIESVLGQMALLKLNVFHWHLTDNEGWRVEIKKYPLLTTTGAWRHTIEWELDPLSSTAYGPDGRYGGYYTQIDIREIVAYANALHITVVPEIEMPGHCSATLSAYPQLSTFDKPYYPFSTDWHKQPDVNAGVFGVRDQTFQCLYNILTEVIGLFPSKYIDIGGDEVVYSYWLKSPQCLAVMKNLNLKSRQDLYAYFIRRMNTFLTAKGRILIGWTQIHDAGLPPNAVVEDFSGKPEPARQGHDMRLATFASIHRISSFSSRISQKVYPGIGPGRV